MISRDLLFEIGSEEIPARFVTWGLSELQRIAGEELKEARLECGEILTLGTPRRLTLLIKGLSLKQADLEDKVRGPKKAQALDAEGQYTKAALGFAGGKNVEAKDLIIENIEGVEYLYAVIRESGRNTAELLPDLLSRILKRLVFPKSMYWEDPSIRFARPVRWLVALWEDQVIPLSFGSVQSGRTTRGHRFMGASSVEIGAPSEYVEKLRNECVWVDPNDRRNAILAGIQAIEKEIGGKADIPAELLEENTQLVEFPVVFYGSFDPEFLDIPQEVLITSMQKNQRYFPVRDEKGRLMPNFIGVSNNKARDMAVVREGNERVLRARLFDAAFFWKEDQMKKLEERVPELGRVLYQEELGSVLDKSNRVRKIANWLVQEAGDPAFAADVDRAAFLAKADLVTSMVFEFPEVQGIMGREYAKKSGESDNVAVALYEQYLPRFAGDTLPSSKVGAFLGLAERADTLVAIHKIGLAPTGSQDPYGLRRAARCMNELIWGLELDIDIRKLLEFAAEELSVDSETLNKIMDFVRQRLQVQLREKGFGHGVVSLVVDSQGHRPLQALKMLKTLNEVSNTDWFASLILAAIRVRNLLLKTEEGQDAVQPEKFISPAENQLFSVLEQLTPQVTNAVDLHDWKKVNEILFELSPAINLFFDEVMVMDEDASVRRNRLAILAECKKLFDTIGDFGLLKN